IPSLSVQNTTKLPMRADLFLAVASSSFLTRLVKLSLISRAKIIATGFPPCFQTRHARVPTWAPEQCSGLKAGIFFDPTWGPDLRSSAAGSVLHTSIAAARDIPSTIRFLIVNKTSEE